MANTEHLTYKDCPYYKRISAGDYSQSLCDISGKICLADEPGLECDIWNEVKKEWLAEEAALIMEQESNNSSLFDDTPS
jgi:hypothetical protein